MVTAYRSIAEETQYLRFLPEAGSFSCCFRCCCCLARWGRCSAAARRRERISLALQGYNFGSGYISWALANYGGDSELNAMEFAEIMAQRMGWTGYGDPYYVQHVLKYYNHLPDGNLST